MTRTSACIRSLDEDQKLLLARYRLIIPKFVSETVAHATHSCAQFEGSPMIEYTS